MKPLPEGGTIGVGAFASSYDMRSEVERGVEWWEARGDQETTAFTRKRLLAVLSGDVTGPVPADPTDPYVRAIAPGRATALLVGGCLWLLLQTLGTPWELETDGTILFFEDTHAPPYYIDGQLTQLRHAGKLDGLAGVVIGDMHKCDYGDLPRDVNDWRAGRSIEDVFDKHLQPLGVPVL